MSPPPPRPAPPPFALKPTHAPVKAYTLALTQLANIGATHETAVREAWHRLIEHCAGPLKWTLVREYAVSRKGAAPLRLDAVLLDAYRIPHGVIEAKDDQDDLAAEMRTKLKLGYPAKNTIFWQPRRAILVQDGKVALDYHLELIPRQRLMILEQFFCYSRTSDAISVEQPQPPPAAFFPFSREYTAAERRLVRVSHRSPLSECTATGPAGRLSR